MGKDDLLLQGQPIRNNKVVSSITMEMDLDVVWDLRGDHEALNREGNGWQIHFVPEDKPHEWYPSTETCIYFGYPDGWEGWHGVTVIARNNGSIEAKHMPGSWRMDPPRTPAEMADHVHIAVVQHHGTWVNVNNLSLYAPGVFPPSEKFVVQLSGGKGPNNRWRIRNFVIRNSLNKPL
jgi:hypothetical protein